MSTPSARLAALTQALKAEKEHEHTTFVDFIQKANISERRAKGVCWYPLRVKETGFGMGEYPFLVVERNNDLDQPHQLGAGKPALLFSNNCENPIEEGVRGTIHFSGNQTLKIILQADDFPEWMDEGKLGIQLLFDDKSFTEMERAMETVSSIENGPLAEIRNIIEGNNAQQLAPIDHTPSYKNLNPSQNAAIANILASKDVALVHGPPGTGKTTTLVEAITQLAKVEKRVLVTAPSNAAVDLLTEKLAQRGLKVVRIGHMSRMDESVEKYSLEYQLANHPDHKQIKVFRKQADEYRRMAGKYKRQFGKAEREQKNLLLAEAKKIVKEAVGIEEHIMSAVLESADAITCTLVGATHYTINHLKFKTVVIDEAGQAMEPATWIPITKAEKVVLAGDPFQLPPTVKGTAAAKAGLGTSLLEVCIKNGLKSSLLDIQYRMNATIMGFSNLWFYQNKLTSHPSAIDQALDEFPLEFIDTAGCSYDEEINPSTVSFFNKGEADILQKHLQNLLQSHPEPLSFGLISPYREQVRYLETLLGNLPNTDIQTVDGFQGNEKDVIYISLVRSNEKGEIGFLMDYRRMNVAMTRARKKLVIIGDSATIGQDKFYKAFLEYAEKHGQYSSAWEWVGW